MVSVVIPNYNYGAFLDEALDSVLVQTFEDLEVIVVDNDSSDNSREVALSKGDSRLKFVTVSNAGSIAVSRNLGISLAKGEYVAFLDSDDRWDSTKLERQLRLLPANASISHHPMRFFGRKKVGRTSGRPLGSNSLNDLLAGGNAITTSSVLFRTSTLRTLGGFPEAQNLIAAEDYALWLKAAQAGIEFFYLPETLGSYRIHASSSSRVDGVKAAVTAATPYLPDASDQVVTRFEGFIAFANGVRHLHADRLGSARLDFITGLRKGHARFKIRAVAYLVILAFTRKR